MRDAMTEIEIAEVEHATASRLPEAYLAVLLHYPAFLLREATEDGLDEVCDLYGTASSLIYANDDHNLSLFPPDCFVIGDNGCGDMYAILTTDPDAPVFRGGPHEGEYPTDDLGNAIPAFKSIYAFVASLHGDSERTEVKKETVLDRITGTLGCLLILPVIVIGSILAALTAPFAVMILWIARWLDTNARSSRCTGAATSGRCEMENQPSPPRDR